MLYSSYYIFGSTSERIRLISSWMLILFYGALSLFICFNVIANILWIKQQYTNMTDPNMAEIRYGFLKKGIMYLLFGLSSVAFYIFSIYYFIIITMVEMTARKEIRFGLIKRVICFIFILLLTIIFHPYFFDNFFQLGQMQQVICR